MFVSRIVSNLLEKAPLSCLILIINAINEEVDIIIYVLVDWVNNRFAN